MHMGKLGMSRVVGALFIVAFAAAWLAVLWDPGCCDSACLCDCAVCPVCGAAVISQTTPLLELTVCALMSTEQLSLYSIPASVAPPPPRV